MRRSSLPLADAALEEDYRVSRFLFGLVRDRCWSLGLHEGAAVRCRDRSEEGVHLELADGRRVMVEVPYARFIELAPRDGALEAPAGP